MMYMCLSLSGYFLSKENTMEVLPHWILKLLRPYLATIFKNSFLFSKTKKKGKHVWQPKNVFYFLFLKIKNKVFLENIFLNVFSCFHMFSDGCFKKYSYKCVS